MKVRSYLQIAKVVFASRKNDQKVPVDSKVAQQRIDLQTDALVSMIGDSQIDYRFLWLQTGATDEGGQSKDSQKSFLSGATNLSYGVSHHLMGDFVSYQ